MPESPAEPSPGWGEPAPEGDLAGRLRGVVSREAVLDAIGGWRGMVDGGLPTLVFVLARNLPLGGHRLSVTAAAGTALAVGLVVVGLRLLRRQPTQQAFSGFLALAVAAVLAARTGQSRTFFLPGIVFSAGYALAALATVLARRPAVGFVFALVEGRGPEWHRDGALRRVYSAATLGWVLVYLLRAGVQGALYLAGSGDGWLATAKLGLGYPLTLLALGLTLWWVRRRTDRPVHVGADGLAAEPDAG